MILTFTRMYEYSQFQNCLTFYFILLFRPTCHRIVSNLKTYYEKTSYSCTSFTLLVCTKFQEKPVLFRERHYHLILLSLVCSIFWKLSGIMSLFLKKVITKKVLCKHCTDKQINTIYLHIRVYIH